MEPENESGPENESELSADDPLPTRIPVSVVEPVPPLATASVPLKDPRERQFPPCEKQPAVRLMPTAKVEVAEPLMVVVADPFDTEKMEEDAFWRMRRFGSERVTAPVAAEAVIWFAVPVILVTADAEVR